MIAIIDYGIGNLASIENMVKKVGGKAIITSDATEILASRAIILPGVGSFDYAVTKLKETGLKKIILDAVSNGKPLLGICLGMQLLFDSSEEGKLPGLGIIPGRVVKFKAPKLKVPHMGWNNITVNEPTENNIYRGLAQENRFYFVHSFHVVCDDPLDISATCDYGEKFTCSVRRNQVYGAQFHPEKSHKFGMTFFKNFLELI